jgi:hypothetical protein
MGEKDYLGKDQRKTKDDKPKDDKPIKDEPTSFIENKNLE